MSGAPSGRILDQHRLARPPDLADRERRVDWQASDALSRRLVHASGAEEPELEAVFRKLEDPGREGAEREDQAADHDVDHGVGRQAARKLRAEALQPLRAVTCRHGLGAGAALASEEPRIDERGRGAPAELEREREILGGVPATSFGGEESQDAEALPGRLEWHGHAGAHAERAQRGKMLGVAGVRREDLVAEVTQEQWLAGVEHRVRGRLLLEVRWPSLVYRFGGGEERWVDVGEREPREPALLVERIDHSPVGEARDGRARDGVGSLAQVERPAEHRARGREDLLCLLPTSVVEDEEGDVVLRWRGSDRLRRISDRAGGSRRFVIKSPGGRHIAFWYIHHAFAS